MGSRGGNNYCLHIHLDAVIERRTEMHRDGEVLTSYSAHLTSLWTTLPPVEYAMIVKSLYFNCVGLLLPAVFPTALPHPNLLHSNHRLCWERNKYYFVLDGRFHCCFYFHFYFFYRGYIPSDWVHMKHGVNINNYDNLISDIFWYIGCLWTYLKVGRALSPELMFSHSVLPTSLKQNHRFATFNTQ